LDSGGIIFFGMFGKFKTTFTFAAMISRSNQIITFLPVVLLSASTRESASGFFIL